jgi:hypothetical protein
VTIGPGNDHPCHLSPDRFRSACPRPFTNMPKMVSFGFSLFAIDLRGAPDRNGTRGSAFSAKTAAPRFKYVCLDEIAQRVVAPSWASVVCGPPEYPKKESSKRTPLCNRVADLKSILAVDYRGMPAKTLFGISSRREHASNGNAELAWPVGETNCAHGAGRAQGHGRERVG